MANGRDLAPRTHAETDNGQQRSEAPARESGARPAAKFYVPLPLGSEAFATPVAPVDGEAPRSAIRVLAVILGSAAVLGGSALALALWIRSAPLRQQTEAAVSHEAAVAGAERSQAEQEASLPEASSGGAEQPPALLQHPVMPTGPAAEPSVPSAPAAVTAGTVVPTTAAPDSRPKSESASKAASERAAASRSSHGASGARSSNLIERPDRAQVIAAMLAVQPAVRACVGTSRDTATANLKVLGRTGRVTSVQVTGMPGPVGTCLARAVRQAHFPKFSADSLTISYPLHK